MMELHFNYRLGVSTIARIIRVVCQAIWEDVQSICIPNPTKEEWLEVAKGFYKHANFPNCVGAIDGKHIRVIKPSSSGSLFYNYKQFFSILLLAVSDSNYRFLYVDIGAYGKSSDSTIFKSSLLYTKLLENKLNIPGPSTLEGSNTEAPHVLIGDEGFGITPFLLRPYGGKFLTLKKRIYNYRLCRARRYIECTFGILSNKWRIFHRPLNVTGSLAEDIIKACCVLHNFVRERDGYNFDDTLNVEGLEDMTADSTQGGRAANGTRENFANYFMNEGQVPWQLGKI